MGRSTKFNRKKYGMLYVFQITGFTVVAPPSLHSHRRIWDVRGNTQLLMSSSCFGSQQNHLMDFMDCRRGSQELAQPKAYRILTITQLDSYSYMTKIRYMTDVYPSVTKGQLTEEFSVMPKGVQMGNERNVFRES